MPLVPLKLKAGINTEQTNYAEKGTWYSCDMIRFKSGSPQKIGGWQKYSTTQFKGVCRAMLNWITLSGANLMGLGTNLKYYIEQGTTFNDITPIRSTVTLGANPFATTSGSTTVVVTAAAHGASDGDFVTYSGAAGFNNLASGDLNKEFELKLIDGNSYSIVVGATPNATSSGGGAAVSAAYQINVGLAVEVNGLGYGAGTYGHDTWGADATQGVTEQLRLYSHDNFGEDLLFNPINSGIYYWDATGGLAARAINLTGIGGASDVPTVAASILVTEDRHVVAFGTNVIGSSTQDPLFIRWADTESLANWTPTVTNTAGGYRLSTGSMIITARKTKMEVIVWTDASLYSMLFLGPPDTFGFTFLSKNVTIAGPNATTVANEIAYWMGKDRFYYYDGRVNTLRCDLWRHVFLDINLSQLYQVFAGLCAAHNEVIWFYCSASSSVINRCVAYNYEEDLWWYGTLSRSAWIDSHLRSNPQSTDQNGYMYWQEDGVDDGSTSPNSPIISYLEAADIDIGNGDKLMFINRVVPDVSFTGSTIPNPAVTMSLKVRRFPGAAYGTPVVSTVTASSLVEPQQYTDQIWVRLRGRQANFRIQSSDLGVNWQVGYPRVQAIEDGRR